MLRQRVQIKANVEVHNAIGKQFVVQRRNAAALGLRAWHRANGAVEVGQRERGDGRAHLWRIGQFL